METPNISEDNNNNDIFDLDIEKKPKKVKEEPVKDDEEHIPQSLEEKLAIRSITNKINKWKMSFKKETVEYKIKKDMTYDQLVELEKEIEYSVAVANGGSMIQSGVFGIVGMSERFGPKYGLQLEGFTKVLATNENFRRILLEMECKYGSDMYVSPIARLGQTLLYTGSLVHLQNSSKADTKENKEKENIDVELNEEYKDL